MNAPDKVSATPLLDAPNGHMFGRHLCRAFASPKVAKRYWGRALLRGGCVRFNTFEVVVAWPHWGPVALREHPESGGAC